MVNVSGTKRSTLERERYVLCRSVFVLVSKLGHLLCVNLVSWVLAFFSCYKNPFQEKNITSFSYLYSLPSSNFEPYSAFVCLFSLWPVSLNSISCSVARDELNVTSRRKHVSTASSRYLYNVISSLQLIDIFKLFRKKCLTTRIHLCSLRN